MTTIAPASDIASSLRPLSKLDEYTDYSCSTPVERLARDVATCLRKWHVDEGADRHASKLRTSSSTDHFREQNKVARALSKESSSISSTASSSVGQSSAPGKASNPPRHSNPRILRSTLITWTISFYVNNGDTRVSAEFQLELVLWDGPLVKNAQHDVELNLPCSLLRSKAHTPTASSGILDNFSSLFGIGQHITLTPINPKESIEQVPALWQQYLLKSIYNRHDRKQTAPPTASHILSLWLQTSVNLAAEEINCCFPIFGWWGSYSIETDVNVDSHLDMKFPSWLEDSIAVRSLPEVRRPRRKMFSRNTNHQHGPPGSPKRSYAPQDTSHINMKHVTPLITAQCRSHERTLYPTKRISFWMGLLQQQAPSAYRARLPSWGDLLLRYCGEKNVHLWEARHVFCWIKSKKKNAKGLFYDESEGHDGFFASTFSGRQKRAPFWRSPPSSYEDQTERDTVRNFIPIYRKHCQQHILGRVSDASGASSDDPLWGPTGDPIDSIWASLSWSGSEETKDPQPLLRLPLKIRSRQAMTEEDWIEAEEAIESTVLNPATAISFLLKVEKDRDVIQTPLAAMQHCILAALIRTSTLPGETLLNHLTDSTIMERWDTNAGNVIATNLGERANIGSTTMALVKAMDWDYAVEDMIEPWQALDICRKVFDTVMDMESPPEDNLNALLHSADSDLLLQPLTKAAPYGRLLSILSAFISRVRSPSSMVQVFGTFVQELRRRWDFRESLPNMDYIPGVDPSNTISDSSNRGVTQQQRNVIGNVVGSVKATNAAYLYSCGEPEPDEFHCLLGQKLQVFNLCLENVISEELREVEKLEQTPRVSRGRDEKSLSNLDSLPLANLGALSSDRRDSFGSAAAANPGDGKVLTFDPKVADSLMRSRGDDSRSVVTFDTKSMVFAADHSKGVINTKTGERSGNRSSASSVTSHYSDARSAESYYTDARSVESNYADARSVQSSYADARSVESSYADARSIESNYTDAKSVASNFTDAKSFATRSSTKSSYFDARSTGTKSQYHESDEGRWSSSRRGARCPVQGQVMANGEQVFAPYLQRPPPLTDDAIAQRKEMLETKGSSSERDILDRLEVAHALQKPKLLSDMSAFKAANPGASLTDFCVWYGDPINPLLDSKGTNVSQSTKFNGIPRPFDLNKATRSNRLLERTRDFWAKTWVLAPSVPASEQEPLFSASNTVEIALDYLETLHPASLMCSVMAANLSNAYFSLAISAGDAASKLPMIHAALTRLRRKIDAALTLLAADTTHSESSKTRFGKSGNTTCFSYASLETISACESACRAIGEAEILLSNALSLLNKFPKQVDLVEELLDKSKGRFEVTIPVSDDSRLMTLESIVSAQRRYPILREYMFRNTDESHPCQLTVRCGDGHNEEEDNESRNGEAKKLGGLLVALTRTEAI